MRQALAKFRSYWIQDVSFITLLLMMVFTIFILPTLLELGWAKINSFYVMLGILFFVGIWSARELWLIVVSALLFIAFVYSKFVYPVERSAIEMVISCLNLLFNIIINLRLLFRDGNFNFERVIGAVNVYLLFALLGAQLFELIHALFGVSLRGELILAETAEDFVHYIYFSMVSLTTVGFGDIFPANYAARMLSVGLSAIGILYPAVVIAKLVSLGANNDRFNRNDYSGNRREEQ
jgi:hypothetical protein